MAGIDGIGAPRVRGVGSCGFWSVFNNERFGAGLVVAGVVNDTGGATADDATPDAIDTEGTAP